MIDSKGGAFGFDCCLASPKFRVFQQPAKRDRVCRGPARTRPPPGRGHRDASEHRVGANGELLRAGNYHPGRPNSRISTAGSLLRNAKWGPTAHMGPRHVEAERLRGFEVEHGLVLVRRLHREVGRLLALKDTIDVASRAPVLVDLIGPVRNQAAALLGRHTLTPGSRSRPPAGCSTAPPAT
jgi:hypothetical protein